MELLKKVNSILCVLLLISGPTLAEEEPLKSEEGFEIVAVSGDVEVLFSGEEDYRIPEEDTFLRAGDKIKTGKDGLAELAFNEEGTNIIRINPSTSCEFTPKKSQKIELIEGEILTIIDKLPEGSSFEIKTPTAVCGARGTDWMTKADKEATIIEGLSGRPYVKGIGRDGRVMREETIVSSGYTSTVRKFRRPSRIVRFSKKREAALRSLREATRERARNVIRERRAQPGYQHRQERIERSIKKRPAPSTKPMAKPKLRRDLKKDELSPDKGKTRAKPDSKSRAPQIKDRTTTRRTQIKATPLRAVTRRMPAERRAPPARSVIKARPAASKGAPARYDK